MIPLLLALMFLLGFQGIALGEGGEPGQGCPDPDLINLPHSGPFILGDFTVALDKSEGDLTYADFENYVMHARLVRVPPCTYLPTIQPA